MQIQQQKIYFAHLFTRKMTFILFLKKLQKRRNFQIVLLRLLKKQIISKIL